MDDIRNLIGNRIRFLRKELNLSQEKLALKAEIDRTYLASVESGKRNISIMNLERIIVALNSSLCDFFSSKEFTAKKIYSAVSKVADREYRRYN